MRQNGPISLTYIPAESINHYIEVVYRFIFPSSSQANNEVSAFGFHLMSCITRAGGRQF